jgi:pyridinium-3,5-bisthiocarboxylic acid mononucleotide nickel chelatase
MKIARTGYGAGGHDFPDSANVLRVILGEDHRRRGGHHRLGDRSQYRRPQSAGPGLRHGAAVEKGALDVTLEPIVMKKGRPGTLLRVLARRKTAKRWRRSIFAETSTLGLRTTPPSAACRRAASWKWKRPHGKVRMKVAGEGAYAPEYEDCRKLAHESGVAP